VNDKQELKTGELTKAEDVLDVVFPSGDEATKVVHPGKEPFNLPASAIASNRRPSCGSLTGRSPSAGWVTIDRLSVLFTSSLTHLNNFYPNKTNVAMPLYSGSTQQAQPLPT